MNKLKTILLQTREVCSNSHIPEHIREKYKIVWEMPMKHVIDMAADRGAFICQSQSMNLWLEDPTYGNFNIYAFLFLAKRIENWYLLLGEERRNIKHNNLLLNLRLILVKKNENSENNSIVDNATEEVCEMCSA